MCCSVKYMSCSFTSITWSHSWLCLQYYYGGHIQTLHTGNGGDTTASCSRGVQGTNNATAIYIYLSARV
jgi:hypothetical protein